MSLGGVVGFVLIIAALLWFKATDFTKSPVPTPREVHRQDGTVKVVRPAAPYSSSIATWIGIAVFALLGIILVMTSDPSLGFIGFGVICIGAVLICTSDSPPSDSSDFGIAVALLGIILLLLAQPPEIP